MRSSMKRQLVVLGLLFSLSAELYAGASLLLTKKRLYFPDRVRSDEITLRNDGDAPGRYEISIVEKTMAEDGRVIATEEPIASAKSFIRYSPRRVTLQPGETQTVRIALRKPRDLAAGEYRSHLRFSSIPLKEPEKRDPNMESEKKTNLKPAAYLSYTIAVVVRHGETSATANIENAIVNFKGNRPHLSLDLLRTGNRSLYGDLIINSADGTEVGLMRGVGVYLPLNKRAINLPLQLAAGTEPTYPLHISFIENRDFGGDQTLELTLPGP